MIDALRDAKWGSLLLSKRRHRWLAILGLVTLLLVIGFLSEVGWLSTPQPWWQTTGWDRLEPVPRPLDLNHDMRVEWLGHSGFLITWHGMRLVTDPNLEPSCKIVKRSFSQDNEVWPGPVQAALISHAHYDHFSLPTLAEIPGLQTIITPQGLERFCDPDTPTRSRFIGVEAGDRIKLGPLIVTAVPAIHRGGRNHPFPSRHAALGYMISDGDYTIYFAGDTADGPLFETLRDQHHPDMAILPIGAYAPRIPLKYHHLNPEEAVAVAERLGVKTVIPCHFGTFRLSFEPTDQALPRFAKAAADHNFQWFVPQLLGAPAYPTHQTAQKEVPE